MINFGHQQVSILAIIQANHYCTFFPKKVTVPVTTAQFHSSYNSQWCYSTWTMIQVNCLPWLQRIIVCPLFPWLGSWCFWLLHLYYARAPGMIRPHSWLIWCGQGPLLTQLVQSRLIKRFWNCKTLRKGQNRACTTTSMNFLLCL